MSAAEAGLDPLLSAADEAICSWPDVRAKQVFGHRGYVRGGKMFAFIAEDGLAFKAPTVDAAEKLYRSGDAVPFLYNGSMEMRGWPIVAVRTDDELAAALTTVRETYEALR